MLEAKGEIMKGQNSQILSYMKEGNSITTLQALELFGCFRLASRINDIKNQGHRVEKEMVKTPNTGKKVAKYYMPEHIEFKTRSLFA